jgi:presequence protease
VDLLKGSLQTFLNAFTYPDRTCYPVASMNTKDFYNLVDVYMDAVFCKLIVLLYTCSHVSLIDPRAAHDPQVMQQEGWHYELDNMSDPLTYKGVVYNEMKGVYSSPDALLGRAIQQALFPDNAYGVDSGGDPAAIPSLTYQDFKDFHSTTYHPSNSRVFFYGDDDPMKRLDIVESYFKDYEAKHADTAVGMQSKKTLVDRPRIRISYPASPGTSAETKHAATLNWLLNDDVLSPKDRMALTVLNHLLLGTSSSALHKVLIESGLGDSVTGGGVGEVSHLSLALHSKYPHTVVVLGANTFRMVIGASAEHIQRRHEGRGGRQCRASGAVGAGHLEVSQ